MQPAATLAAGVVAAAQLGDVSPVSPALDRALGLSPAASGAAVSLITLVAAVAATPIALALRRRDPARLVVLGLALGMLLGWRGWLGVVAVVTAGTAVAAGWAARAAAPNSVAAPGTAPAANRPLLRAASLGRPLCLASAFCLIAAMPVGVASLLPGYMQARGVSAVAAGTLTSVVSSASVPGSLAAGVLLRRGVRPPVIGLAVLGCPAAAAAGFADLPVALAVAADIGLVLLGGLGVAAAYGALPAVAGAPEVLPVANGLLVQLGSLGTLVVAPVFAAVTGLTYWSRMPVLLLVPALGGVVLLAAAYPLRRPATLRRWVR